MLGVGRSGPRGERRCLRGQVVAPEGEGRGLPARDGTRPRADRWSRPSLSISERDAWVVLNGAAGVGPVSFARLVAAFGDVRAVLGAARGRDGAARLVTASAGIDGGSPSVSPKVAGIRPGW